MGDISIRTNYKEFIKGYGYALCRLISNVIEQPFYVGPFERQVFGELITLGGSIYGTDNAEKDFKEANKPRLKPYTDLYDAVTQAIEMTGNTLAENHRSSVYQELYPLMLIESYGAFQKDVANAFYIDEKGLKQPLRDLMPRTVKFSEIRQTALKNALDFIETNSDTHIIDYQFDSPEALALVESIMQIIEKCRNKEEIVPEEQADVIGRELTGSEANALTLKLYKHGLYRFTERAYDEQIETLLDALEVKTAYKTHWNRTQLEHQARIEHNVRMASYVNGKYTEKTKENVLIVSYEKDRYVSSAELRINGRPIASAKNQREFHIDIDFLANHHRIEQIDTIEVIGYRKYDDRNLMNEANEKLNKGFPGWFSSVTSPNRWDVSIKMVQLSITLMQSLHALQAVSDRHYQKIAPIISKRKKYKRPHGKDYESLWILTAFLMIISSDSDLFTLQKKNRKKKS